MSFEQTLRDKISKAPFRSKEKELFKVVLGTIQQKASSGKVTDEQGIAIVKAMVGTNNEMLFGNPSKNLKPIFVEGDPRRLPIEEENRVLSQLLPTYLTAEQIETSLSGANLVEEIKNAKGEPSAMGLAMKHFKATDAKVEGDTVKLVIQKLRA